MKQRKTPLLLLLTGCLSFLTACSAHTRDTVSQMQNTGDVTISVMAPLHSNGSLTSFMEENYPNYQLDFSMYPEDQYYTILKSRLATGKATDLVDIQPGYAGPNGVEEMGPAGYLYPLYPVPEGYSDANEDNLLISDGMVYGKAGHRMTLGIIYNKELFENHNIPFPQCWEDFLSCCSQLQQLNIQPLTAGYRSISTFQYPLYQLAANQLYPQYPDFDEKLRLGEAQFTDKGTWDCLLKSYFELFENNYLSLSALDLDSDEAAEQLLSEKAAMMFSTSLSYNSYVGTDMLKQKFYFAPFPANPRGEPLYISEALVGGFGIYAASPYAEELKTVLTAYHDSMDPSNYVAYAGFTDEKYKTLPTFYFCNQGWPNEVEIVMEYQLASYLSGNISRIEDITAAMQQELEK